MTPTNYPFSMEKFGDYGIAPIKCETRVGGADVKDWLYKVNDILYRHKLDYVCPALLKRMKEDLRVVLVDFYNTEVPPIAQSKKEEILRKGKALYNKMKDLEKTFVWNQADEEDIEKVLRYWVAQYVKEKPFLSVEKAVEMHRQSKQAYEDYYLGAKHHIELERISTGPFTSMLAELKTFINSALGL